MYLEFGVQERAKSKISCEIDVLLITVLPLPVFSFMLFFFFLWKSLLSCFYFLQKCEYNLATFIRFIGFWWLLMGCVCRLYLTKHRRDRGFSQMLDLLVDMSCPFLAGGFRQNVGNWVIQITQKLVTFWKQLCGASRKGLSFSSIVQKRWRHWVKSLCS